MTIDQRMLTALLLAPLTVYELSRMLSAYPETVRKHTRDMRTKRLLRIAKFEKCHTGSPGALRARYTLSPRGQSAAKELLG